MDQIEAIWIKEETNETHTEPDSVTSEDPLKMEELSLHIKEDSDLKLSVDGSGHNLIEEPLRTLWSRGFMKERGFEVDEAETIILKDPLKIEELSLHTKEDPELKTCGDGSGQNVVASTTYASGSARLIKNSAECCGISFEETVNQGVINDGLNKDAEESTHSIVSRTGAQGLASQEEVSVGDQASSADNKEKFHCSDNHKNIRLSEGVVSFVEQAERQSSSQETCVASRQCCNVICNTQTALHHTVKSDRDDNYLISPTTSNVSAQPVSLTKERPYKCVVCGKCYIRLAHLKTHSLIHTGIKPHKCDTCGKSFTKLSNSKRHALIHSGIKTHKCNACGKSFTQLSKLKGHALIHSGIKPHKCDTCGKSFTELSKLKSHALIHSGIKPHKCDTCGIYFNQLGHLKEHALIHSGIKPHKCDTCGKSFTKLSNLKGHALIHSEIKPHKCDTCGKSFTQLSKLKGHALIHSGINPNKCDTCGKSFTTLSVLKKHALIHTEIKPYKCDTCGKSFTQLSNRKRHALIHSGIKPHKCDT